jgi:hypothetical protein
MSAAYDAVTSVQVLIRTKYSTLGSTLRVLSAEAHSGGAAGAVRAQMWPRICKGGKGPAPRGTGPEKRTIMALKIHHLVRISCRSTETLPRVLSRTK